LRGGYPLRRDAEDKMVLWVRLFQDETSYPIFFGWMDGWMKGGGKWIPKSNVILFVLRTEG